MRKRLLVMILAGICSFSTAVSAADSVRVVVLPFQIHSADDLSQMNREIPRIIEKHLTQAGAEIIEPEAVALSTEFKSKETRDSIQAARKYGIRKGADYVIWGSSTWIGTHFSLDVKVLESFSDKDPVALFLDGDGAENLPATLKKLALDISMKLFKQEQVSQILVSGNSRIEADAIRRRIKTQKGDMFKAKQLSSDLKAIFSMGFFDDVRIESEDAPDGKTVLIKVKEKPTIRVIRFEGNDVFDDDEMQKDILDIQTGSILNIARVRRNVERIKDSYEEKNYHNVRVDYKVLPLENNQADIEFVIQEGQKLLIEKIVFSGNTHFEDDDLKDIMKTAEKGFFSWITSSGDLNTDDLDQDTTRIAAYYQNHGYIQARVSDPQINFLDEYIEVAIKIDEGPQFKVGNVTITGEELVLPMPELEKRLSIKREKFYNRESIRNDVLSLTDLYSDLGYAYANIAPKIEQDPDNLLVDITFNIDKGKPVYFEKIIISGNSKTRDKVIRRELKVYEQELYSGLRLKRGVRNLHRLDYFEDVKIDTLKGSADDKMILKVDVTEKPTGNFSFGGGYSNIEQVFGMVSLTQRNLFGRGQTLQAKAQIGSRTNRFDIKFTEPWLFDIPLSGGIDLYNWDRDYDEYQKNSIGGALRTNYPVYDYTRAYLSYVYDISDIYDVLPEASDSIKAFEGTNAKSAVSGALRWDSRDRIFNASRGSQHSLILEYAGLGGDIGFTKSTASTAWYIPLFYDFVGFAHGKLGYMKEQDDKALPDWEKYYLGGINSLRGYDWREVGPKEISSAGTLVPVGGEKMLQFNFELHIPLIKQAGVVGILFYDTGNAWRSEQDYDLADLRSSVGYGFRWYSPIGPIRLEYGYVLDPEPGQEQSGRWEFAMGAAF
jgi:outer membrane protein insertion porin family